MPQTSIEKIVQRYAVGPTGDVRSGDIVAIRPKHVMTHDNTGAVIPKFQSIGATKVRDPKQPVFGMDHDIQNTTPENLGKYAKIEKFARDNGIDYYPPGRGIAHQVMIEEGYVTPGSLVVGSDSHSNIYGAAAAVGTPVVRTDAAAIWATGETWWQVPDVVKVTLTGELRDGAVGKDVIIALCGHFNSDEVLNCVIEFVGPGVTTLSMDERLTISNMTTEWGALAGMFPFDETLLEFLLSRAAVFASRDEPRYTAEDVNAWWEARSEWAPDKDAYYAKELTLDLSQVAPHVSGPDTVKDMTSVADMQAREVRINKAYLMSCVNARESDFAAAARVFARDGGRRVAEGVDFYVAAASSEVEAKAKASGDWDILMNAGARALPPGCGACIGLGTGLLEAGEVGISATNRNFKGRMGSRDAQCYLASPAVVAESAIRGIIASPMALDEGDGSLGECAVQPRPAAAAGKTTIIDGFPARMEGRSLFLPQDNLNTDGIYGKDVTYRDDITLEQQGQYAMLNYDPAFQQIAQPGDIIVGGANFGSGSSREQAATALASFGIKLVIAETFSATYTRNAFNNGFVCIVCPDLVAALREANTGSDALTIPGDALVVNFEDSEITLGDRTFRFPALGPAAQELVAAGGSENVVKRKLAAGG